MVQIKIVTFDEIKEPYIRKGEEEYLKRMKKWCKLSMERVPSSKRSSMPPSERKKREFNLFLERIKPNDFIIALDERGTQFSSVGFAKHISQLMTQGRSSFIFVIGGAYGLSSEVRMRANLVWSLSDLTFPFQLSRLILIEQLYRIFSIMKGTPYHKE